MPEKNSVPASPGRLITVLPMIRTEGDLRDLLARMAWGIGLASFHDCVIFVADAALAEPDWTLPEFMDPAIAANFPALRPRVRFVVSPTKPDVIERVAASDFIVFAEDPPQWDLLTDEEWTAALARKKILRSDPVRTRQEFGNWVELNFQLRAEREAEVEQCRARFARLIEEIGRAETAYCLATGPSLASFKETNFAGALSIVCNSAILDEELMAWVRPRFLVFADPIFHFGPSTYAAEFRRRLRESCVRHDYTIIVPMRYYGLLTDAMPELRGRTIGIPSDKPNGFNLDLASEFRVFTTANILTYLMLPLASTLARRIYLLGCDGRPLDESGYFWQHNKKTQINDEMENIRLVHPGFFVMDYNDYYLDHCRQLEELISEGERMGREYGTVTPSYIPALQSRPASLPRMLVIDFTEIGARNATGQLKAALFKNWPADRVLQVRPLSTRDGSFFRLHSPASLAEFREAKLTADDVRREAADFDPQVIYFRPTDSPPEFLELGWELVQSLDVPVVTHVMDDWPERLRMENPAAFSRIEPTLRALLERSGVRLSISDAMSAAYRERYGCEFRAVANGIEPDEWKNPAPPPATNELVVRYCGGLTDDMTTASVEAFARVVGELRSETPIRFEIYALPAALKIAQERFREFPGVEVLPSVEWADYPALLATAGAVLIAYNFDERTRTYTQFSMANKLPECLASGAPLIVFGPETIATVRRARELGAAVVVVENDGTALKAAVRRLASEPAAFREVARQARERALTELTVDRERQKFQAAVGPLDRSRAIAPEARMLLGPYTRLQRRRIDDAAVAAAYFRLPAARVVLALGAIDRRAIESFVEREWTVVTCGDAAQAGRYFSSLAPTFGKDTIAVILCTAGDYARLGPLPIRTVATLVYHSEGDARMAAPTFEGARMVWSERFQTLLEGGERPFRGLREIVDPGEIPPGRAGVVIVMDPAVMRIPRGAGDAVVQMRKAYAAALGVTATGSAAPDQDAATLGGRLRICLRAWIAAIGRMNVRFQVSRFVRERFAEAREVVAPTRRGRVIVWK